MEPLEKVLLCEKCGECPQYMVDELDLTVGSVCPTCWNILDEVCAHCLGTGEVSGDEDDGEGHTARGVTTETCPFINHEDHNA